MITEEQILNELKQLGLSANKFLGQHFLRDEKIIDSMVEAIALDTIDTIIEVGPGLGILTKRLAETGKRVVAIEKDKHLSNVLKKRWISFRNVEIVSSDILVCDIDSLVKKAERYAIVANLPYNITARFLKQYLSEKEHKPVEMVVMIQKEVAERMSAPAGRLTKLGLLSQIYSDTTILINTISKDSFVPPPKVLSAVVRCVIRKKPLPIFPQHEQVFWRLVRIGFSSKRKMLSNNLFAGLHISSQEAKEMLTLARISPSSRAEDLTVKEWVTLVDICLKNHCR